MRMLKVYYSLNLETILKWKPRVAILNIDEEKL